MIPTYDEALTLLMKYNSDAALVRHGICVGAAMRYFARQNHEDEEQWSVVGLLHDLDYELYPDQHCAKTLEILKNEGVDDSIARACASHGWKICIDLEPQSLMEKTLYTIDELTGLIYASALMRPSRSILDLEIKSVKKKFKTRSFAAGVNRELIEEGAQMLDMPLDTIIEWCIAGMREKAVEIGLEGIEA